MTQQNEERYYNVSMYTDSQELRGVPHFDLTIIGEQGLGKNKELRQTRVKVTYSKLTAQVGYDRFQQQMYNAILQLDESLEGWMPTILYRCIEVYSQVSDIKVEQAEYWGGLNSSYISSRLAELFDLDIMKEPPGSHRSQSMQMQFTVQGRQFDINDPHFTHWVLEIIKEKIRDNKFPYSFGLDMLTLRQAILYDPKDSLSHHYNVTPSVKFKGGREPMIAFLSAIHSTICAILKLDVRVYTTKQLCFYSSLAILFDLPHALSYRLPDNDQKEFKRVMDKFKLLLKRASDK